MFVTRTVDPTAELVTLAEAKAHLRVDFDDDDGLISGLVAAAAGYLDGPDGILGRALLPQTLALTLADAPPGDTWLPCGPVTSVTSVTYYDLDNAPQTFSDSDYSLIEGIDTVTLEPLATWPSTFARLDAFTITYEAGDSTVPAAIRQAALLLVGLWYEQREAATDKSFAALPMGVRMLLLPYRRAKDLF
jgi:uncharacterized phiE125 gp8 family phage protein